MVVSEGGILVFLCPHCGENIIVYEADIACAIFRHAIHKNTMEQINPHASKEECDRLVEEGLVYGCAGPFRILKSGNSYHIEICEYI
jgi:hypothetical protein